MGLINNDGIIFIQIRIILSFSQQDAICHDLDKCIGARFILESDFVTDRLSQRFSELLGNPF